MDFIREQGHMNVENIYKIAKEFRGAIILMRDKYNISSYMFPSFPDGKCEYTSYLFKKYLDKFGVVAECWGGSNPALSLSHVWLQIGEICVDLTASQFVDFNFPEVLVVKKQDLYPLRKYLSNIKIRESFFDIAESDVQRDLRIIEDIIKGKFCEQKYLKEKFGLD
ncbi:hypothetical protein ABFP33_20415 [Acinetobacter bereziniae]|uniref:hypothetical protein n=1 Tax=Acinetobacter bereziniae TaxID=106648 RepID=UPI003215CEDB